MADMKKEIIIKTVLIIIVVIVVFTVPAYLSNKKYEAQKIFFVNSCIDTFYYDNSYELNTIVDDFVRELPSDIQKYIDKEFGEDYIATIDPKYNIENLCKNIFDFYKEAQEENTYDHCESYRCK
jgi:hypothetical protein